MVASLTLLPVFVPEGRRGAACFGGFAGCLVVLLGVCCLYTGGDWFPLAALGSLFGLGLAFLPLVLRSLPLPEGLAHRQAALYVGIELVLLFALLGAACLDSRGTWFVSAVVWTLFGAGAFLLPPLLPQLPLPAGWQRHKALVYFSWETLLLLLGLAWEGRNGDFPLPSAMAHGPAVPDPPLGLAGGGAVPPREPVGPGGPGAGVDRPVGVAGPLRPGPGAAGHRLDQQPAL